MRARMVSSSSSQILTSSGSDRMIRTAAAPWSGGIDQAACQRIAVGKYRIELRRIGHHGIDRTNPVTVHAEVLVARIGHQRLGDRAENAAQAIGVFFHARTPSP
ncbi:MAG: hypothetical protein R3E03_03260 [Novosphingobium sp.]